MLPNASKSIRTFTVEIKEISTNTKETEISAVSSPRREQGIRTDIINYH